MSEWRGWLISVDSKATGRRLPGSKIYAVRIADPKSAMSAVRKYAHIRDEHQAILVEASVAQLRSMKVPDQRVRQIISMKPRVDH